MFVEVCLKKNQEQTLNPELVALHMKEHPEVVAFTVQ